MDKDEFKHTIKKIMFALVWGGLSWLLAIILNQVTTYKIQDLLFLEGLILTFAGACTSMDIKFNNYKSIHLSTGEKVMMIIEENFKEGTTMIPLIFGGICSMALAIGVF